MSSNKLLSKLNKFLDRITEPVPEIADNGLNEDFMVSVKQVKHTTPAQPVQPVQPVQEIAPVKESKKIFGLSKSSNDDTQIRMENVEVNHNLSQLLTATTETVSSDNTIENSNVDVETTVDANGYLNTEAMTKEELFDYNMKVRDDLITGFSDTCFDTIEGIQSNRVISEERKIEKINSLEKEFLEISNDDFDAICLFFKKVRHELHMLQNNVGEYDNRIYLNGLINNPKIREYRIAEMHMDDELYKYLAEDDMNAMEKLLDMCEEIHRRAQKCNCLATYTKLTEKRLISANTTLDLLVAEEKFDDMLMDLNVKINTTTDSSLLA